MGGAGENTGGDVENMVGGGWCNLVVMKIRAPDQGTGFQVENNGNEIMCIHGRCQKVKHYHAQNLAHSTLHKNKSYKQDL